MFCSRCGKTLMPEDQKCPHCGSEVGESRFEGTPYTSAQPHIKPEDPAGRAVAAYTRTTYTTMPEEQQEEGPVDSRTSYRPVFEGGSSSDEIRRDMRAVIDGAEDEGDGETRGPATEELSDEAISTLNAVDEELHMDEMDTSALRSRPIESTGRAGISSGVENYIQKLEASQSRKAARRRRAVDEGEDAYATPEGGTVYDDTADVNPDIDTEQSEVFNDIGEEEFDDIPEGHTLGLKEILRVAAIMIVAAALVVGGVLWFRGRNQASSKIDGVTQSLYESGVELIKARRDNTYINELINVYRADSVLGLTQRVTADAAAIDALLPAEPAVNDPLFISALQTIHTNIGNAVLMDASEAEQGVENAEQNSQTRWSVVDGGITTLQNATTAQELTAILNGDQVTVVTAPTASPTPEPAITYNTLQKGDKNDEVLEMQTRLYQLGFLLDDRDGQFGTKTQTAVKAFQQAAGLEVNGIADNETLTRLYAADAPTTEYAPVTPTPAA